jgi:ABC-2 type transport system permease protein
MLRREAKVKKLGKYWRIFWHFRRLHLMRTLEYRTDFLFWSLVSTMWTIFNYFYFGLLTSISGNIGGWELGEIYVLLSVFTILDGIFWSFFVHNMRSYTYLVFSGELNGLLIKPIDSQFLLMTQNNSINNIPRILLGMVLLVTSIISLEIQLSAIDLVLGLIAFVTGGLAIYFTWFMIATLAFYMDKLENINEIIPSTRKLWQVPRQIYTGGVSILLTMVTPLGLIVAIPSEFLVGRGSLIWLSIFLVQTALIMILSRLFFIRSIKRYSGIAN